MKDIFDYEFPALAHPTSFPDNDKFENDPYFDDGEEIFDDGVPRQIEEVEKPKPDVEKLLQEIESRLPDDVIDLFGMPKRKKRDAA